MEFKNVKGSEKLKESTVGFDLKVEFV